MKQTNKNNKMGQLKPPRKMSDGNVAESRDIQSKNLCNIPKGICLNDF